METAELTAERQSAPIGLNIETPLSESLMKVAGGVASFSEAKTLVSDPELPDKLANIRRHDLLPLLFKIRGQPYTLDNYPQFEPMYASEYPPDEIWMCGRQVAKSTNLSRSEGLDIAQIPNFQILYVAPLQSQAMRYSTLYLHEAVMTCDILRKMQSPVFQLGEGPIVKSVGHQAFANNSGVQMMYAKTSADRARGITADRIDFDEIQDQLIDHIPIIKESTTNSPWGVHRYTGTAKTTDNAIEYLWRQSSQAEWAVRCGCGHWNIPDKTNALYMISASGPVCVKCGSALKVREGVFVHANRHLEREFPGYHIPQIVVPAIVYDPVKWSKLVNKIEKYPESIIFTEILGISHDAGARLITQADIDKVSILGTHHELRQHLDAYSLRVVAVDWGVAEVSSFTVASVLGYTSDGKIHVLFGKRYVGKNPEEVITDIIRIFNSYQCHMVAADFGVGYTNNVIIGNKGIPVSQVEYVKANKLLTYKPILGSPRWTVDRNTALSMMFWGIKFGKIFFPNPEDSSIYTADLLSPYETVVEQSSGITSKKFLRDPSKPDDFAHALTFGAMMIMRMAGDPMLNMVPETSLDYAGMDFPIAGMEAIDAYQAL